MEKVQDVTDGISKSLTSRVTPWLSAWGVAAALVTAISAFAVDNYRITAQAADIDKLKSAPPVATAEQLHKVDNDVATVRQEVADLKETLSNSHQETRSWLQNLGNKIDRR